MSDNYPPVGVSILTSAGRDEKLARCLATLLAYTQYPNLHVQMFYNGRNWCPSSRTDLLLDESLRNALATRAMSFTMSSSPEDLGCSKGTNGALELVREFPYAIHLESDFELLPPSVSGVDECWLKRAVEFLEQTPAANYLYLRRMTGPAEMRAHWWAQWQARLTGDGEYLACPGFWWSNNPALRRNEALYAEKVLPLPELDNDHKGHPNWGRAELSVPAPSGAYLHRCGMFVHDPDTQENGYQTRRGCGWFPTAGQLSCKYHFFMRGDERFCQLCDLTKGREEMQAHADRDANPMSTVLNHTAPTQPKE